MIVKMKFVNISGPRNDIDRVTNLYLSRYEIQLESALSELKTVDNLRPFVEINPYRDVLKKAEEFVGYLPDVEKVKPLPCSYSLKILHREDFEELYRPEWSNALCRERKHLDVLGVGAYDGKKLVGLAGCSADCDKMWQIGVDVLQEYRRAGIASALTSRLAVEILERGKVPFYCSAWSNIRSVRNGIKSGFIPAWVEMTVKPAKIVQDMNEITLLP